MVVRITGRTSSVAIIVLPDGSVVTGDASFSQNTARSRGVPSISIRITQSELRRRGEVMGEVSWCAGTYVGSSTTVLGPLLVSCNS
jgi:hypothetical protein